MFSDSSVKKVLKRAGALRVSERAIKRLKVVIEEYALLVSRKAVKSAEYSGRKSVKVEDIEEALKVEE